MTTTGRNSAFLLLRVLGVLACFAAAGAVPAAIELDEPPQPLQARHPRTEAQEDRVEALALFAAARTLEQRQEHAKALRLYQRAFRCDPQAGVNVIEPIVVLADQRKDRATAARYALKADKFEEVDPLLLRRLGVHLVEEGDFTRAVALYEKAVAARGDAKPNAADILLQMELGRLYQLVDKPQKAAGCLARVIAALDRPTEFGVDDEVRKILLGEAGPSYQFMGECFLAAGRLEAAADAFKKAHAAAANKPLLDLSLARVTAASGKPLQALADMQPCFDQHLASEGTMPYELLADVLKKLGKEKELIERLEKIQSADPKNAPLAYFLAGQYRQVGKLDKAESLYLTLTREKPSSSAFQRLLEIYRQGKQLDTLLTALGQAVEKTGLMETLGAQGRLIAADAELMRGLVETARKKLKGSAPRPGYGMPLGMAVLAMEAKQFDAAGEFFQAALAVEPKQAREIFLAWGLGLLVDNRAAEAVKVYRRAIDEKFVPADDFELQYRLAGALAMADRTEEALVAADKASKSLKDDQKGGARTAASRVAWILYRAKRYDEAMDHYRKLVAINDSDYESAENRETLREARLALSGICVVKKQLPEAEEWLQQVLDEFPDDVGAANDLGYLWADQGRHLQRALAMIQRAVAAEPDNAAYRDSLGWIFCRTGRYDEAVAELEKAVAGQSDSTVLEHLGDACQKSGRPDKARDAWRRAAEAFRKEKNEEKAKEMDAKIRGK